MTVAPALALYFEQRNEAAAYASPGSPNQDKTNVADKPILTGDPEYDAWEIAETSTERDFGGGRNATHYYR